MNAECALGSALTTRRPAQPLTARQAHVMRELLADGATADQLICGVRAIALTRREDQVLQALIHGADDSNKAVAHALGLTEGTVKIYFSRLSRKIAGKSISRVAMALWAERRWNDQS